MTFTEEKLQELYQLAHLDASANERAEVLVDISRILGFLEKISVVDTHGIDPITHPLSPATHLRDDSADTNIPVNALQAIAPDVSQGYYLVPKVISEPD